LSPTFPKLLYLVIHAQNLSFPQEWAQVPEQCHSSDNLDNNMETHPPLPPTVSEVATWEFTSPHNPSMAPASLSCQSDPSEQVLFRNPGLNIPADNTLPSPCTDDIEVVDTRVFKVRIIY